MKSGVEKKYEWRLKVNLTPLDLRVCIKYTTLKKISCLNAFSSLRYMLFSTPNLTPKRRENSFVYPSQENP